MVNEAIQGRITLADRPGPAIPRDDLARFCCQDPDCDAYGRRGGDNLLVIRVIAQ
jgi:hypothetical protein